MTTGLVNAIHMDCTIDKYGHVRNKTDYIIGGQEIYKWCSKFKEKNRARTVLRINIQL